MRLEHAPGLRLLASLARVSYRRVGCRDMLYRFSDIVASYLPLSFSQWARGYPY